MLAWTFQGESAKRDHKGQKKSRWYRQQHFAPSDNFIRQWKSPYVQHETHSQLADSTLLCDSTRGIQKLNGSLTMNAWLRRNRSFLSSRIKRNLQAILSQYFELQPCDDFQTSIFNGDPTHFLDMKIFPLQATGQVLSMDYCLGAARNVGIMFG
jgi:hypothetical protein